MWKVVIVAAVLCLFLFVLAFLGIAQDPTGTLDAVEGMEVISAPIELFTSMASQMAAVWLFSLTALVATKLICYLCIFLGSKRLASPFVIDFSMGSMSFYVQLLLKSAVTVSMSFIALFVGLLMRSSKATIVTSFLLILLTQGNIGDLSLAGNQVFPVILTLLSFGVAVLSVVTVETKGVL
ncbi:MAG: ABC transporter permease [Lachnospiraceae bacterium]